MPRRAVRPPGTGHAGCKARCSRRRRRWAYLTSSSSSIAASMNVKRAAGSALRRTHKAMRSVSCVGGTTQIARVLTHTLKEARANKVNALIFGGDAMEEKVDELSRLAGELGILGAPVFVFHEDGDEIAGRAFRQIAKLSGGAYCPFDAGSAQQLRDLLGAVAAFAGGPAGTRRLR